ncbi:GIY-YIG nuclease family protein [Providencia stuartii]|uniref:GIY-YIG nuclease family protein n=1 Tax=Providencia TaxID=586 RepID=UPI0018C6AE53|nr:MULTISPECIES: GIY-YIG nuclease family protein [Providencia]MBG5896823.1 GIY-YIG nuclease family protein [Providencia stuartii]
MTKLTVINNAISEQPTMTSLEMVDYINAVAVKVSESVTVEQLEYCLSLLESARKVSSDSYHHLYKAVYCHISSLISSKLSESNSDDCESGIYLIEFDDGNIKIGMTQTNFDERLRVIRNQTAASVIHYDFIQCEQPSAIEALLHRRFSNLRGNGEFFYADYETVKSEALMLIDRRNQAQN